MRAWRRQYGDVLRDRVARGEWRGVASLATRWVSTALSPRLRRPLGGPGARHAPRHLPVQPALPRLRPAGPRRRPPPPGGDRELDTAEMKAVLRDFKAIGTLGVGVTGGEPMLRDDLVELLRTGGRLGLHMHLNTDGFRVDDAAARDLVRAGVRSVNVSLDGATPGEHDLARGRAGAFRDAVAALAALRRARGRARPAPDGRDGPHVGERAPGRGGRAGRAGGRRRSRRRHPGPRLRAGGAPRRRGARARGARRPARAPAPGRARQQHGLPRPRAARAPRRALAAPLLRPLRVRRRRLLRRRLPVLPLHGAQDPDRAPARSPRSGVRTRTSASGTGSRRARPASGTVTPR